MSDQSNLDDPTWKLLGHAAVDSGQLLVTDPCYIRDGFAGDVDVRFDVPGEYSYSGCCSTTTDGSVGGELGDQTGVVFCSGFGDGTYPVYAHVVAGRVLGVTIDMGMNYFDDDAGKRAARQRDAHINLLFKD